MEAVVKGQARTQCSASSVDSPFFILEKYLSDEHGAMKTEFYCVVSLLM